MDDRLSSFRNLSAGASNLTGYELSNVSGEINALVDPILSEAKTLFASGQGYQDIYAELLASLGDVQSRLLSESPLNYEQASLDVLGNIDDLLGSLQSELSIAELSIVGAIDLSRIETVGALERIQTLLGNERNIITDGSHANGIASIPFDGYIAKTHKDEAIIDAGTMSGLRKYGIPVNGSRNSGDVKQLLPALEKIKAAIDGMGGDLKLQVVTTDGKVLKEAVISDILKRSKSGEVVVYAQGVLA